MLYIYIHIFTYICIYTFIDRGREEDLGCRACYSRSVARSTRILREFSVELGPSVSRVFQQPMYPQTMHKIYFLFGAYMMPAFMKCFWCTCVRLSGLHGNTTIQHLESSTSFHVHLEQRALSAGPSTGCSPPRQRPLLPTAILFSSMASFLAGPLGYPPCPGEHLGGPGRWPQQVVRLLGLVAPWSQEGYPVT